MQSLIIRFPSDVGGVAKSGNSTRPSLSHISKKKKTCDFSTANCMGIVTIASHCCGFFLHCPLINLLFVPYVDDLACVHIRNVNGTWDNAGHRKTSQLTSQLYRESPVTTLRVISSGTRNCKRFYGSPHAFDARSCLFFNFSPETHLIFLLFWVAFN